jgi:hypothetical protein
MFAVARVRWRSGRPKHCHLQWMSLPCQIPILIIITIKKIGIWFKKNGITIAHCPMLLQCLTFTWSMHVLSPKESAFFIHHLLI